MLFGLKYAIFIAYLSTLNLNSMKFKLEYSPLVIIGFWNKAILSPNWVSRYIFPKKEIHVEFPINNSNASLKFNVDGISLNVIDQRLLFSIKEPSDQSFELIGTTAMSLCRSLPHTPVSSFGINHIFESSIEEIRDGNLFDLVDRSLVDDGGYDVQCIKIGRTIKFADCILNLSLSKKETTIVYDFNYHYDISSIEEFIQKFDPQNILHKKEDAIKFLDEIYGIKFVV